jgi:hypothetical protein
MLFLWSENSKLQESCLLFAFFTKRVATSQMNSLILEQSANFRPLLLLDASPSLNSTVTHLSTRGLFGDFCSQLISGEIVSLIPLLVHQRLQSVSLKPLVQKLAPDCLDVAPVTEALLYFKWPKNRVFLF